MNKLLCLALIFGLLGSIVSITHFTAKANDNFIRFENITIKTTEKKIDIDWDDIKDVERYKIVDEIGNQIYDGKNSEFKQKNMDSDTYSSLYLVGIDKNGDQVTERISITAKTKSNSPQDEKGFTYILATTRYVELDWEPILSAKGDFTLYKNGEKLLVTSDTFYRDEAVINGFNYDYSLETVTPMEYVDENGEPAKTNRTISYQTSIDTSKISNSPQFKVMAAIDSYYPVFKFKTFIRQSQVYDAQNYWWGDSCGNDKAYFGGDNRGFSASSSSYRTQQIVNIDFNTQSHSYSENAGQTHGWCVSDSTGKKYGDQYGTASMNRSSVSNLTFNSSSSVSFKLTVAANNPLVSSSPDIDAVMNVTIYRGGGVSTGTTAMSIDHDGFPDYEIYRTDGALATKTLYQWDAAAHNDGIYSLFAPMEHSATINK